MPLQNRVDPFGNIVAHPSRGTMMGNRGRLHDAKRQIGGRRWATKAWICCRLAFRGRQRAVMTPGSYTELFFLDEATAFSAGHRPCYECRRADYNAFLDAWSEAHHVARKTLRAAAVDARLHGERVGPRRSKPTFPERLGALPSGTFVTIPGAPETPWLLWDDQLHRWSPSGYGEAMPADPVLTAGVLTPPSTVAAFSAGYRPSVYPGIPR